MTTQKSAAGLIEAAFTRKVQRDKKVKNACLRVYAPHLSVDLNIADGHSDTAHPDQPHYMASVGKLFTASLVAILHEQGKLTFDDKIACFLDEKLMDSLHIHKGKDFSGEITVRHLLTQSSGLYDVFWPLLNMMLKDTAMRMTPVDAIEWGKKNLKTRFKPGQKHYYTDTNYYLLGLIIENVTKKPFDEVLHQYIFEPLKMQHSYMLGCSVPALKSDYPIAGFYIKGLDVSKMPGYPGLDYAGGGVVAPVEDLLKFMQALVQHRIVQKETLDRMLTDDFRRGIGMRYGYSIWKFVTLPLIMPVSFNCWGCVGATGAFMFYHPRTDAYIIGNFNDVAYMSNALQFMLMKVIKPLNKAQKMKQS